jgi:hypothetical protein
MKEIREKGINNILKKGKGRPLGSKNKKKD